jgi:hypothetical protein
MNIGFDECDIYGWDTFAVPPNSQTSLRVPSFHDYVSPGEFVLLLEPIIYDDVAYECARVIKIDHPLYLFIQLASDTSHLFVPKLTAPCDRSYVYYPKEIALTNIGTFVTVNNIKSIALVVSTKEVEDTIWGQLASIQNIFLLRFQLDYILEKFSAAATQQTFLNQTCNSYTLQVRNVLLKIIIIMKRMLNGGAISRPMMESEFLCLSDYEWKYICTELRVTVQEFNSMEAADITRDRVTREMIKKLHLKELIEINTVEELNNFRSVFGQHSVIGYRERPPTSKKSAMKRQSNGVYFSDRTVSRTEELNVIDGTPNTYIKFIYNKFSSQLQIHLRFRVVVAHNTGLLNSIQQLHHPTNLQQLINLRTVYHDGTNVFEVIEITGNTVRSRIRQTTNPGEQFVTHDMAAVYSLIQNLL